MENKERRNGAKTMKEKQKRSKVLFICVHNSARSQMAETWLNALAGDRFAAESAGLDPTTVNPLVVEVMKEEGFDLASRSTRSAFDLYKAGQLYDYVITVCDAASEKQCPVFPGVTKRLHWGFEDPEGFSGNEDERMAQVRDLSGKIKNQLEAWLAEKEA